MTTLLWMGEHPILTVILAAIVCGCLSDILKDPACPCSQEQQQKQQPPTTQEAKDTYDHQP